MNNYKFPIGTTIVSSTIAVFTTEVVNLFRRIRYKKLANAKLSITDRLNQEIGYLRCKRDELKEKRACYETRNIFKRIAHKKEIEQIDSEICNLNNQIRDKEQQIAEIRSSNTIKMLRYVENNMNYIPTEPVVKQLPYKGSKVRQA